LNSAGPKEKCGNQPRVPERLLILRGSGSLVGRILTAATSPKEESGGGCSGLFAGGSVVGVAVQQLVQLARIHLLHLLLDLAIVTSIVRIVAGMLLAAVLPHERS
jgi:hypothetical protein